jgi:hypothetical protein
MLLIVAQVTVDGRTQKKRGSQSYSRGSSVRQRRTISRAVAAKTTIEKSRSTYR